MFKKVRIKDGKLFRLLLFPPEEATVQVEVPFPALCLLAPCARHPLAGTDGGGGSPERAVRGRLRGRGVTAQLGWFGLLSRAPPLCQPGAPFNRVCFTNIQQHPQTPELPNPNQTKIKPQERTKRKTNQPKQDPAFLLAL